MQTVRTFVVLTDDGMHKCEAVGVAEAVASVWDDDTLHVEFNEIDFDGSNKIYRAYMADASGVVEYDTICWVLTAK